MELDKNRIEDAIVREVADGIMHEDELRDRVKHAVDKRIDNLFNDESDDIIAAVKRRQNPVGTTEAQV